MIGDFSNLSRLCKATFKSVVPLLYWYTTDRYLRVPATLAQHPFISVSLVSYLV